MKYSYLKEEFGRLMEGDAASADSEALLKLRDELVEKKAKFTHKLKKGINLRKRDATEAKLEGVQEMIKDIKIVLAARESA